MGSLILKAAISYIEKHPEVIEQVIEAGVPALINWLQGLHGGTKPAA